MAYGTIMLQTNQPLKNGIASGSITPGMVIERTSTADTVQAHSTDRGRVNGNLVAVEDTLQGNGITTAYATTKRCRFVAFQPGDEAYLLVASGQNISIGDKLVSNGSGYLEKQSNDSSSGDVEIDTFATALEACDATAAAAYCRAEIA